MIDNRSMNTVITGNACLLKKKEVSIFPEVIELNIGIRSCVISKDNRKATMTVRNVSINSWWFILFLSLPSVFRMDHPHLLQQAGEVEIDIIETGN